MFLFFVFEAGKVNLSFVTVYNGWGRHSGLRAG